VCDAQGVFHSGKGESNLFIYPGYRFKAVDALITNFHLPDSTPLLLACAFYGFTSDQPFSLRFAYEEAIREKYRFYSYGDAMFIQ
jgi:S-adenosylmethionine:tRNA ribosyltransferase-isomerase